MWSLRAAAGLRDRPAASLTAYRKSMVYSFSSVEFWSLKSIE